MPLIDVNDPIHLGIRCNAEPDGHPSTRNAISLTYARTHVMPILRERWAWLAPLLGLTATSSVCIVGAGYGYSLEILEERGITRTIGTEPSAGLRAKMAVSEDGDIQAEIESVGLTVTSGDGLAAFNRLRDRPALPRAKRAADVLNEDMATAASRNRVRQALQGKGGSSWDVITENVLTVLSDAECTALSNAARQLNGIARLIHLVSTRLFDADGTTHPGQNAIYNWKTLQQWKALIPADTFVSIYTRALL